MSPEELKFFEEVDRLLNPVKITQIEYRLFYNELGEITSCTMIVPDDVVTDPYIVVTKEEYERYAEYRVADSKLKKIEQDAGYCMQLAKSITGIAVVAGHAGLIIESDEVYNNVEYYERKTNN